ncbi:MAG: hypothetical protein QM652_11330 [Legionella sp.]|uniref:hypothetical protein n=1 Tax=Legionella sp. TaxID=459 RepID=UPI0039E35F37
MLSMDSAGYFEAVYSHTKNCYINWDLSFLLSLGFKSGEFISCLIDVEFEHGICQLSLGGFGEKGYYQSNKTLKSSGKHCFAFQATSCIKHKDSLFSRLYFYPDCLSKRVKVNSFKVIHGYLPDLLFWE